VERRYRLSSDLCPPPRRLKPTRDQRDRPRGLGHTVVVAVQDDPTRLVYAELHGAENATNVAVTLRRGAQWNREQGLGPVEAVMSDNRTAAARRARNSRPSWEDECAQGRHWPTPPSATAHCHRLSATSTADALTALSAAGHPPPAFSSSEGRTASGSRRRARGRARARATDR
jgi:hypothetical protein